MTPAECEITSDGLWANLTGSDGDPDPYGWDDPLGEGWARP